MNTNIDLLVCQECSHSWECEQDFDTCNSLDIDDDYFWEEMSYRRYVEVTLLWHHSELGDI